MTQSELWPGLWKNVGWIYTTPSTSTAPSGCLTLAFIALEGKKCSERRKCCWEFASDPHNGLNGQDFQLLEQQVFQCSWHVLVGWKLYSALPPVHTATHWELCCSMLKLVWISLPREALSSTMQTKACSRSSQHLPVTALPEHTNRVVVFLGRVILSSANLSSGAILPTQHLPVLQPFLFLSTLRVTFAAHPAPGSYWTGQMRPLSFSREDTACGCWVPRRITSNIFSPSGLSVAAILPGFWDYGEGLWFIEFISY